MSPAAPLSPLRAAARLRLLRPACSLAELLTRAEPISGMTLGVVGSPSSLISAVSLGMLDRLSRPEVP